MRADLDPQIRERFRAQASSIIRMAPFSFDETPNSYRKAYALGAADCLDAALRMNQGHGDRTPEKILTFHALELGLKAYLISQGIRPERLARRPFGHDLDGLYVEANKRGLQLQYREAAYMLEWINEWHSEGAKIRYDFVSQRDLRWDLSFFPLPKK